MRADIRRFRAGLNPFEDKIPKTWPIDHAMQLSITSPPNKFDLRTVTQAMIHLRLHGHGDIVGDTGEPNIPTHVMMIVQNITMRTTYVFSQID